MSDGGAVLILETEESVRRRNGGKVYCELAGYGQTCDAYHILRPTDHGTGLVRAI